MKVLVLGAGVIGTTSAWFLREHGHEVTIVGYNTKGVKIENSWGSGWGARGFFTVPWSFFNTGDVDEIHAMGKLVKS